MGSPQTLRKAATYTPNLMNKARRWWERGRTDEQIQKDLRLRKGTVAKWREERRPDGRVWEREAEEADLRSGPEVDGVPMIGDKDCPTFWDWVRDAKPCIDSKDKGIIPFKAWPGAQTALCDLRISGQSGAIDKARQTGASTAIAVCDAYLLIHSKPYHCNYVSKDETEGDNLLEIVRLALLTAELTPGQRACLDLGTDKSPKAIFKTKRVSNYVRVHAPRPGAGRGPSGNAVLMDEAAWMPNAAVIYTAFRGGIGDGRASFFVMSTQNPRDQFFKRMLKHAEERGFVKMQWDWRARPDRGPDWFEQEKLKFDTIEDAMQEHCCLQVLPSEMAFDPIAMRRFAGGVPFIGSVPIPGHAYLIGIDQSSVGSAATCAYVIDCTMRPAQVVFGDTFMFVRSEESAEVPTSRTLQKAQWADRLSAQWNGALVYIDVTNDRATAEMMQIRNKVLLKIRGQTSVNDKVDENDGLRTLMLPRSELVENGVKLCDTGQLVVHPDQFPELYEGFETARRHVAGEGTKKTWVNPDYLDALLIGSIQLTRVAPKSDNHRRQPTKMQQKRVSMQDRPRSVRY